MEAGSDTYAAFLSYDEADRAVVERIAGRLEERGVSVFFGDRDLIPGEPWQEAIEEAFEASGACVVFLGSGGMEGWANERMRVALQERVQRRSFRVIPALLPGSRFPGQGDLPRFLKRLEWADLRAGADEERALEKLISGILGKSARSSAASRLPQDRRPYQGLQPFQEADADFFFGRSALIQRLVEALREGRFLAIVGPSGSGKSSVARAGLIQALRQEGLPGSDRWRFVTFAPGVRPIEELAISLGPIVPKLSGHRAAAQFIADLRRDETSLHLALRLALSAEEPAVRALFLVDQLEEIFTLCQDETERQMFIENLLYAAGASGGRATVVLALRADFYARTAGHRELADLIAERQVPVTPMEEAELKEAIVEPAQRVGLSLEPGLTEVILGEMRGQPGALPFLEHALFELWERRSHGHLTHEAFRAIGGVEGAVARRADATFGALTAEQQALARRVLLRLVQPGEITEDTRRRARSGELFAELGERGSVEAVVSALAASRLLTVGRDAGSGAEVVEVSHEALIRGWPRLRGWIEESRTALLVRRRIGESAAEWERLGRDPDSLWRGAPLSRVLETVVQEELDLSFPEREFLEASQALRDREERERVENALQLARLAQEAEARLVAEERLARFEEGHLELDGFRRLLVEGRFVEAEIDILRAYCRFLWQTLVPFSPEAMESTLAHNPAVVRLLVDLFLARFDPAAEAGRAEICRRVQSEIDHRMDGLGNLDEERILRSLLHLIEATLRTNFFQRDAEGGRKPYLALKIDSQKVDQLPRPRPFREIFIWSPRMEAIHLRGGPVARGGIRWSDRKEDFRTEALGLLKTQMSKNAVIVPVGAKGAFIVKRHSESWEEQRQEGIECYRMMMRGLLDLTDNLLGEMVIPPRDVVRYDADDSYLAVAADKGTATFSDIANGVAAEYGFWLGDAFAAGGSTGYDHKLMGITARGVWEAVKRHFREMKRDPEQEEITVAGVGDMSGDIFGNGMLLSRRIRLVGAFDHRHIFVDPAPDPEASYRERRRLFDLPRSSWADYNRSLLWTGGGVFERTSRSIAVSPEMAALFSIPEPVVTPDTLIRHLLRAEVDLLWLGGIGTYVKASTEAHSDARDRFNDPVRVDARELRCRIVGEGANLGFTQKGRVEYALAGGRINVDFLDNCGGIDCSDHEVNVKVALDDALARGRFSPQDRERLLVEMTEEVAQLVLRNNDQQTQGVSLELFMGDTLDLSRFVRRFEKAGFLDRRLEALPDEEDLTARQRTRHGLTRPEIAVLVPFAKIALRTDLLASDLPEDPGLTSDLLNYFPRRLENRHRESIEAHALRREIIATVLANEVVDRMGVTFANRLADDTGSGTPEVALAYLNSRDILGVRTLWDGIEALDRRVSADQQLAMMAALRSLLEQTTLWFLLPDRPRSLPTSAWVTRLRPGVEWLFSHLGELLPPAEQKYLTEQAAAYSRQGAPVDLALAVAAVEPMALACEIVELALTKNQPLSRVAPCYLALGERFHLRWLRQAIRQAAAEGPWQKAAGHAFLVDLAACQTAMTSQLLATNEPDDALLQAWEQHNGRAVWRVDQKLADLTFSARVDLAMITALIRRLRDLAHL